MAYHKWAHEAVDNKNLFLFLGCAWDRDLYQWSFDYGKTRVDTKMLTEGPELKFEGLFTGIC